MNFIRRLRGYTVPKIFILNEYPEYDGAGIAFTDNKMILAGYQQKEEKSFISGIGGKKEDGESYLDTAVRETIEELFEFDAIPQKLLAKIRAMPPQRVIRNGTYIVVVYNFTDLECMLRIIKKYSLKSKLYDKFPTTLMNLVLNRKLDCALNPEISHLALLPLVDHKEGSFVDKYFLRDMTMLLKS